MTPKLSISQENNRNKLILIGNGFDLAHGLKTSYADFLFWYLQNIIDGLNNAEPNGKYNPKCNYKDDVIEVERPDSKTHITIESIKDFIDLIASGKITINNNDGDKSFLEYLIELSEGQRWVDIEYEYFLWLTKIYDKYFVRNNIVRKLEKLNKEFAYIQRNLEIYIDFKYKQFLEKIIDDRRSPRITNIINQINNTAQIKTLYFLNFNYTNTIDDYINGKNNILNNVFSSKNKNQITVSNIHGSVFDNKNPIIFGYGDDMSEYYKKLEDKNIDQLTQNFKTFHYLKTRNYKGLSNFINSGNYDVYILGHSCGVSDRALLNMIFENEKCNSIQIFHYKKANGQTDFLEKTQGISRCISQNNYKINFMDKVVPYNEDDWMSKAE